MAAPPAGHEHHHPMPDGEGSMAGGEGAPAHVHPAQAETAALQAAGVDEKLGGQVADATLYDSEGHVVRLSELLTVPTIILPVYYTCPDVCFLLQSTFARVLPQVALAPGKEIQVLSVSFDDRDTPQAAAKSKRNYMKALSGKFPPQYWKFLTGSEEEVGRVMDSIGFRYQRVGDAFAHPVVIVAVAPGGKIVRYLYGMDFLPFDITMAATEAAEGKVGLSVKRMLSFCFNYDPEGRRYVFDLMRVSGAAIMGFAFLFLMFLLLSGRRKKRGDR